MILIEGERLFRGQSQESRRTLSRVDDWALIKETINASRWISESEWARDWRIFHFLPVWMGVFIALTLCLPYHSRLTVGGGDNSSLFTGLQMSKTKWEDCTQGTAAEEPHTLKPNLESRILGTNLSPMHNGMKFTESWTGKELLFHVRGVWLVRGQTLFSKTVHRRSSSPESCHSTRKKWSVFSHPVKSKGLRDSLKEQNLVEGMLPDAQG